MDATQAICDSILESDEENEGENEDSRGQPLAKLCVLENGHIPKTEIPLFLGDNVLGRDQSCSTVNFPATSVSKQHATISIIVHGKQKLNIEALVWDHGSLNGTRKGRLKLTPHVRYSINGGDSLVIADIPCTFIRCDSVLNSLQENVKNKHLEKRTELPNPLLRTESSPSQNCVSEGSSVVASLFECVKNTPVGSCGLSFEKTPSSKLRPQDTLVPESDSDSEGDNQIPAEARRRALVSTSDSFLSSPNSSTFMSPANKIVPESEDDMSTPASADVNLTKKNVRFVKNASDVDVGHQQLKIPLEIMDDSDEEETTPDRSALKESSEYVEEMEYSITGSEQKESLAPTETVKTAVEIPEFNMDSDTDVEEENDWVMPTVSTVLSGNQDQTDADSYHLDSDTDVENTVEVSPTVPPSDDKRPPKPASHPQPAGLSLDSDTDVEDEVSESAAIAEAVSTTSTGMVESAPSTQPKDFHLDSDTDVEDEEDRNCESGLIIPRNLQMNSDTDDEVSHEPCGSAIVIKEPEVEKCNIEPFGITSTNAEGVKTTMAAQAESDADTDVSEVPDAGEGTGLGLDSDTDVEMDVEDAKRNPIKSSHKESSIQAPSLLNCSTPVQLPGNVHEMETQAFLTPQKCEASLDIKHLALSPSSGSLEEEDFVVAETQSFVLQDEVWTRQLQNNISSEPTQPFVLESSVEETDAHLSGDESFKLGLSDSSHMRNPAQDIAMASTQPFGAESVSQEDTQVYKVEDIVTTEHHGLEAMRTNESEEGSFRSPAMMRGYRVDLAMQETQAFILEPSSDSDEKQEDNDIEQTSSTDNQPLPVETQPTCAVEDKNGSQSDDADRPFGSEAADKNRTSAAPSRKDPSMAETKQHLTSDENTMSETKPLQETTPAIGTCDTDSDGEDSMPMFRKRKSKPLKLEDESQSLNVGDTQALNTNEDENSMSLFRKRKARPLRLEDESQSVSDSVSDTQPVLMNTDEETETSCISIGGNRRRQHLTEVEEPGEQSSEGAQKGKGKKLRKKKTCKEEISLAETQPILTNEDDEEDEEVIPGFTPKLTEKSSNSAVEKNSPEDDSNTSSASSRWTRAKSARQNKKTEKDQLSTTNTSSRVTRATLLNEAESSGFSKMDEPMKILLAKRGKQQAEEEEKGQMEKSVFEKAQEQEIPKQNRFQAKLAEQSRLDELEQERVEKARKLEQELMHDRLAEEERLRLEKLEEERIEKEKQENLEQLQVVEAEKERLRFEKLEEERVEKERQELAEREQSRLEKMEEERIEKERQELAERERSRLEKMEEERIEKERQELAERERSRFEKMEEERIEKERQELAERERSRLEKMEEERIEKERQELAERERSRLEKMEEERIEKERQELAERERSRLEKMEEERVEKERKEMPEQELAEEEQLRPEKEQKKVEAEREEKVEQDVKQEENKNVEINVRGRRGARRMVAASKDSEQDSAYVRVTRSRSRSNSSNSVTSETSTSSIYVPAGRGRGAKKTSPIQTTIPYTTRRRTVAVSAKEDGDLSSPGVISRSNSSTSLNSEVSHSSSQKRGRGGRQRGRGRKSAPHTSSHDSMDDRDDASSTSTSTGRGLKGQEKTVEVPDPTAATTRGQRRTNVRGPTIKKEELIQEAQSSSKSSLPSRRTIRGQKIKTETTDAEVATAVSEESQEKQRGQKRELQESAENENAVPTQAKRRGRPSKALKVPPLQVEVREEIGPKTPSRGSGKKQMVQIKENRDDQSASAEEPQPQTPARQSSRKRQASVASSPLAKTPKPSSASPAGGRLGPSYKVLYTGVDEVGEKVLTRLGGSMAKGVADMNCLVTDKVRRTVKFLCAVAKGIPVVTTSWLEKSGKAGSFLSPSTFLVKDPDQEEKFNFSLEESLRVASIQPLLQGFEIHITKSVKPEPVYMKDILSCSGATFLPKMPSSHKPQTLVISCEEDSSLCAPAFSASIPVLSAEFILSGILQQKLDLETHKLCAPAAVPATASGRGRPRKKS